jgi:hypothetical protein
MLNKGLTPASAINTSSHSQEISKLEENRVATRQAAHQKTTARTLQATTEIQ